MINKNIELEVLIKFCGNGFVSFNSLYNLLVVHCEDKEFIEYIHRMISEWEKWEDKV